MMKILDTRLDLIFPMWLREAVIIAIEKMTGVSINCPPGKTLRIEVTIVDIPVEISDEVYTGVGELKR